MLSSPILSLRHLAAVWAVCFAVLCEPGAAITALKRIDEELTTWKDGGIGIALVSASGLQFFFKDNSPGGYIEPPNSHTTFNVGPVKKGFTGLLLADQMFRGNVNLNDTLRNVLTDWPGRMKAPAGNITLRQLATQSSGILNSIPYPESNSSFSNATTEAFYEWLDSVDMNEVGTYEEGEVDCSVLGYVLAIKAGKSYEELLKERVNIPLGLKDTKVVKSATQKGWVGTVHSSVSDLASFLQIAMGLRQKDTNTTKTLKFSVRERGPVDAMTNIGLGWMLVRMPDDVVLVGQSGQGSGSGSIFVGWFESPKKGVVLLSNAVSPRIDDLAVSLLVLDF